MTVAEIRTACDAVGAPYRMEGDDCICVLDMTQIPDVLRVSLRQDGYLRGHGPDTAKADEPAEKSTVKGEAPVEKPASKDK